MNDTDPSAPQELSSDDVQSIQRLQQCHTRLKAELGRVIVGQTDVIDQLATVLFSRGHALLMGVPGLVKTLLIS